MTVESNKAGTVDKYRKPVDLLQLLLDAEVGTNPSKGNAHLTMRQSEEDYNSNYEVDSSNHCSEASSRLTHNYLTAKPDSPQVESIEQQSQEKLSPLCDKRNMKLSLDVSETVS